MKKYISILFLIVMTLIGCSSPIGEVPLENFKEHRQYLEGRSENKNEDFQEYEKLLIENPKLGDSPYIYYYLSRLENNEKYLIKGLILFPNDPWINFNKRKYLSDEESLDLYEKILKDHPRHSPTFINYINYFNDFLSQTFTTTLFLENSSTIKELNSMVISYENGDPKSSDFYDFNSESQSLNDTRKNYINNQINIVKTLYTELEETLEIQKEKQLINQKNLLSDFVNKKVHPYPFWCEEYLIINDDMTFTRIEYNSRINGTREYIKIKGKLLPDGTIEFYTNNEWFFRGNIKKTIMTNKWERSGGTFRFFDRSYQNRGYNNTGWRESETWYSLNEECI